MTDDSEEPMPEVVPDDLLSTLSANFALHVYGLRATGATRLLADYIDSTTVAWAATDLGLIDCAVHPDRIVFNLTLWRDVADVELRVETVQLGGGDHFDYWLTVQHPRLDLHGTGNVREFVHEVVRMAAAQPVRTL
jgi:hypothetical protein